MKVFFFMHIESDVEFGCRVKGRFHDFPCSECGYDPQAWDSL